MRTQDEVRAELSRTEAALESTERRPVASSVAVVARLETLRWVLGLPGIFTPHPDERHT